MGLLQDLKDAYTAGTGSYPSRLDRLTDADVIAADVERVQAAYGSGEKASTTQQTGGTVTAADILAIFEANGVDAQTGNETAQQRTQRIADEINAGTRTITEVTTTIQGIAGGSNPNDSNPNAISVGTGVALNGIPGKPEVWKDAESGQ